MKNIIKIAFLICPLILFLSACEKEISTGDLSRTTFFPDFDYGEANVLVPCGEGYTDSGATATENGNAVDVIVSQSEGAYFGDATIDGPDLYTIDYSAINSDGFEGTVRRNVQVLPCNGDLVSSIEGLYISTVVRTGGETHSDLEYVYIRSNGTDAYLLSHGLGGFYEMGRGFGYGYGAYGCEIAYDGSNYSFSTSHIPLFGLDIDVTNFVIDPASKTISYHGAGAFANGDFDIMLTQVQL